MVEIDQRLVLGTSAKRADLGGDFQSIFEPTKRLGTPGQKIEVHEVATGNGAGHGMVRRPSNAANNLRFWLTATILRTRPAALLGNPVRSLSRRPEKTAHILRMQSMGSPTGPLA